MYKEVIKFLEDAISARIGYLDLIVGRPEYFKEVDRIYDDINMLRGAIKKFKWLEEHKL